MNNFVNQFSDAINETAKSLSGLPSKINFLSEIISSDAKFVQTPIICLKIHVKTYTKLRFDVFVTPLLANTLANCIMGHVEVGSSVYITKENLHVVREVFLHSLDLLSESLKKQHQLSNLQLEIDDIIYLRELNSKDLKKFFIYTMDFYQIKDSVIFSFSDNICKLFENEGVSTIKEDMQSANYSSLMDFKLDFKVRMGSVVLNYKDFLKLHEGSVLDFDALGKDSLEILVNNKVVALGKLVKQDKRFDIQILSLDVKS